MKEILPEPLSESLKAENRIPDDEEFFERRDEKLGGEFNDDHSLPEFPMVSAIAIACSYAVVGQGETYFSAMQESYLEDLESNLFEHSQLISVSAVQASKRGVMSVDNFFCLKERQH